MKLIEYIRDKMYLFCCFMHFLGLNLLLTEKCYYFHILLILVPCRRAYWIFYFLAGEENPFKFLVHQYLGRIIKSSTEQQIACCNRICKL